MIREFSICCLKWGWRGGDGGGRRGMLEGEGVVRVDGVCGGRGGCVHAYICYEVRQFTHF